MLNKRWYNKHLVLCQPRNQDDNELTSHHARCSDDMVSLLEAWGWLQSTEDCLYGRISGWMVQKGPWVKGGQTMLLQSLVWQSSQGQSVQKTMKLWRHRVRPDVQMNTKRPLHRNLNDHKWAMITDTLSSTWCYHVQTNPVQIHRLVKLRRTLSH